MRPLLLTLASLVFGSATALAIPQDDLPELTTLAGDTPAQWRVIWTESPQTRATISWTTAEAGGEHRVHMATASMDGDLAKAVRVVDAQRSGEFTQDASDGLPSAYYHHARLEGLKPSTTYWFVMESDAARSRELHFTTAPADDREFRIVYGGDSRSGREARARVNLLMAGLAEADDGLMAFCHGGDYIFNGRLWEHWGTWLSQHELTTGASGKVLPIVPVRGNHDIGPLYDEIFDAPGGAGKNYYVVQLGAQAAILTLNSEISTAGDQALWLEDRLAELRPANRWLLAQFHRPVYPAVKQPGPAKATWVPLFERFDLDLVLESDGHVVKRTMPIRDDKFDPTGVTYIGEGGLGVPQRTPDGERWYLKPPGMTGRGHHVTVLEFSAERLRMRTVGPPLPVQEFVPKGHRDVLAKGAHWLYLAGEEPAERWTQRGYDDSAWRQGPAGFGYGDDDDATVLEDMRGEYERVYARREFPASALVEAETVALMVNYDDAFIAYLNGEEVLRVGVGAGRGAAAKNIASHEARRFEYFELEDWRRAIAGADVVVLAIEGHNDRASSSDFTLDPYLIVDPQNSPKGGVALRVIDDHELQPRTKATGAR